MKIIRAMANAVVVAVTLAAPASADPDSVPNPNDDQFITAITGDGISMDQAAAIREGHAVCMFLAGGSIWNAIAQVRRMHPDWSTPSATRFVDRSIQHYCPAQAPL